MTCIGFSAIFVRWANTTGDVATFFRLGIAALVMTLPVLIQRRRGRARLDRSALPFALPLLGEAPQAWHVVGGLVTLGGIYTVHRSFVGPKESAESGVLSAE